MAIKATWDNLKPGTKVRCIYPDNSMRERFMKKAAIVLSKPNGGNNQATEGLISLQWDDGLSNYTEWAQPKSFELVGPVATWENLLPGMRVKAITGMNIGVVGTVFKVEDKSRYEIIFDSGIIGGYSNPNDCELYLEQAKQSDLVVGAMVMCLKPLHSRFGHIAIIKDIQTESFEVRWQVLSDSGIWYEPSDFAIVNLDNPSIVNQTVATPIVSQTTPIITNPGFDWDAYHGFKKPPSKFILDPRGGIRYIS